MRVLFCVKKCIKINFSINIFLLKQCHGKIKNTNLFIFISLQLISLQNVTLYNNNLKRFTFSIQIVKSSF